MATREERIRKRLFDEARPYSTEKAGFVPLPIILRRCQFLFTARAWQVYCYALLRAGPAGVAWFTADEMAFDLGFGTISKLRPYVAQLVEDGWLLEKSSKGRHYYLAPDPQLVIQKLHADGRINDERFEAIEELVDVLQRNRAAKTQEEPRAASA